MSSPEFCPECGAEVPINAKACPECGADESTGWNDRAVLQRLGSPIDDDSSDGENDFSEDSTARTEKKLQPIWLVTAGILVVLLLPWVFSSCHGASR